MTLTVGLWVTAGLLACTLAAGVAAGVMVDAVLSLRDLRRGGRRS